MNKSLLEVLADPVTGEPLQLQATKTSDDGEIEEGLLRSPGGTSYPVTNGIPRFVLTEDRDQKQTQRSFGYKWEQRSTYESPAVANQARDWIMKRYGFGDPKGAAAYFGGRRFVLDAGCGGGLAAGLYLADSDCEWVGMDISSAIDVARDRLGRRPKRHYVQGDVLQPPFRKGSFDTIVSEGVLHHTPSTRKAIESTARLLAPDGEFLFYVYRKKGPIREFSDDHVRAIVSDLEPQAAWERLRPLTQLGKSLAELKATVSVPEDIPYLGIKAGTYDVQRLIYWNFIKLFWSEGMSFDENLHINFDWYHPRYAHRQTEEEVRAWCAECGLSIQRFDVEESGFTVRALKGATPKGLR